jgi:predicted DNA-binding protein (MmcQ/YjbR family)
MHIEELREYCLHKKGATESFPFDETTLVFKVGGKMFLLTDIVDVFAIAVKMKAETVEETREKFAAVSSSKYLHKKYWNTILIDGSIPDKLIKKWIDKSYHLVFASLTKKGQAVVLSEE